MAKVEGRVKCTLRAQSAERKGRAKEDNDGQIATATATATAIAERRTTVSWVGAISVGWKGRGCASVQGDA
jgi:hypothetical protein